ncbi:MAG: beta-ketoacyl-[acyl-carrier-protein] synthase family protein [Nitrospirota bacterium]
MNNRVVITGLGIVSSIGIGWREFWENLVKGKSGITPVTSFDTSNQFTHMGGEVKNFNPDEFIPKEKLNSQSRASQLALAAAKLAVEDANLNQEDTDNYRIGVSFGTTLGDAQAVEDVDILLVNNNQNISKELIYQIPTYASPSAIAREFKFNGQNFMFSTACSASNYAIGYGYDLIRLNRADIIFAGGSDPFSRIEYTGFNRFSAVAPERCQPFDKNRKGMILGEGAGVLVLESLENALKRKATIYAEILGYGLSCDAYRMTASSVEGIAECMRKALREGGIKTEDVDYISAHGTGTILNDKTECAAIKEVFGHLNKKVPISSIKSMLGHTMGAGPAIEAITCALVVKNNIIPPTINYETPDPECDIDCVPNQARKQTVNIALNNSYAFGGNNACVVVKKFTPPHSSPL